jgi:hypothetical protein
MVGAAVGQRRQYGENEREECQNDLGLLHTDPPVESWLDA